MIRLIRAALEFRSLVRSGVRFSLLRGLDGWTLRITLSGGEQSVAGHSTLAGVLLADRTTVTLGRLTVYARARAALKAYQPVGPGEIDPAPRPHDEDGA